MSQKLDQHQLLAALRELAITLGRTPTRDEFRVSAICGSDTIRAAFGSYATLVQAAGLDPVKPCKALNNRIFEQDLATTLEQYVPLEAKSRIDYAATLFIGDCHFPFVNQKALEFIYAFTQKHKPQRIVQVGDLYDMYAHSKYPKSLNVYTPNQEEDMARAGAQAMWKQLRELCPDAECVQLKGNHDIRPLRRTLEVQPAIERAISKFLDDLMTFDGVRLISDSRQEYFFDDVQVLHGHYSRPGQHRDYSLMNTVHGHTHKGNVSYRRFRGQTFWEMDVCMIGDPESKSLGYTAQKTYDSITGLGWLDELGPRVITL